MIAQGLSRRGKDDATAAWFRTSAKDDPCGGVARCLFDKREGGVA